MLLISKSKCVIVLGAHRSGTSACAGLLHALGVNMGPVLLEANEKNPKGFFEDLEFCGLHHLMIRDWLQPSMNITSELLDKYSDLVKTRSKQDLWGIKDPKLCLVMPYVISTIKKMNKVYIINISRDFDQIIASFTSVEFGKKSRFIKGENFADNIFSKKEAERVTKLYLEIKNRFLSNFNGEKLNINYKDLIDNTEDSVNKIASFIDVHVTEAATIFIDRSLKHY